MGLDNWCSPPEVADPLEQFFDGPVDFDPCSNDRSIIRARFVNDQPVGCLIPWFGAKRRTVYENPPYSKLLAFTQKGILEMRDFRRQRYPEEPELVRLTTVATSTLWWRMATGREPVRTKDENVFSRRPTVVFTQRLFFINEQGIQNRSQSARFDSALFYYGPREKEFLREFKPITSWSVSRRAT